MTKARDLAGFSTGSITNTTADGLILKGDGSSTDVIIKNGADATVASVADGTVNIAAAGSITATGAVTRALTRGSIDVGNSSGVSAPLAKGTAGTVLTSDGTDLSFAEAGGGAMEFISSQTPSNVTAISFTGFDNSKYLNYKFEFSNIRFTIDNRTMYLRTSSNGGSSWDGGSSDYKQQLQEATTGFQGSTETTSIGRFVEQTSDSTAERGIDGTLTVFNPGESTLTTTQGYCTSQRGATSALIFSISVITRMAASEVNAIQFGGGTFASGTISMYGLKKS